MKYIATYARLYAAGYGKSCDLDPQQTGLVKRYGIN